MNKEKFTTTGYEPGPPDCRAGALPTKLTSTIWRSLYFFQYLGWGGGQSEVIQPCTAL